MLLTLAGINPALITQIYSQVMYWMACKQPSARDGNELMHAWCRQDVQPDIDTEEVPLLVCPLLCDLVHQQLTQCHAQVTRNPDWHELLSKDLVIK